MLTSVFCEEEKKVVELPLSRIVANPDQPRRYFDIEALTELASSIE